MSQDPSPVTNRLPMLILLLTAVGVPTAAGLAFAEQVTQNPWKALGLALLYEVLVLILGFVTKVWQRLESQWVDAVAKWVDSKVQELFSRYRRRYLQHLIFRHRTFDVKGLTTQGTYTLALEKVFVELRIAPRSHPEMSGDPIRVPEELRGGRRLIWDYLQSKQMANQNLAIIGPPGSGKTTLLRYMALTLAGGRKRRRKLKAPDKLPIVLFLRDHAQAISAGMSETPVEDNPDKGSDAGLSLAQAAQMSAVKSGKPMAPADWFEKQLEAGRCLIMLDGLDEVADLETRKQVVKWVERQMTDHGKNRFLITSRPHGYRSNPLSGVTVLQVQPFNRKQVKRFVDNWYLANEIMSFQKDDDGVRMEAEEGAEDLLKRIRGTQALSDLAVNPLLLTMIATVHRYRSALPGRRVELYAEICEVFLGKRQAARGLTLDLTPAQKQRVLQPLAYHVMCEQKREIPQDEALIVIAEALELVSPESTGEAFLKMIENESGLLVERESGVYGFAHKTFQEYLAAAHVQEQKLERVLVKWVGNDWWNETIRLYAAQADATPIIAACLAGERPTVPALALATECLDEAREVQPAVRAQLESVLAEGVEDEDQERRRLVAEALLALRLR